MKNFKRYSTNTAKALIIVLAILQLYSWASSWYFYDTNRTVTTTYTIFFLALHGKRYEEAYALTGPSYRDTHTLKEFVDRFQNLGIPAYALNSNSVVNIGWRRKSATVCPSTEGLMVVGPCYEMAHFANEWWMTGEISSWSFD